MRSLSPASLASIACCAIALASSPAAQAQQVAIDSGSIVQTVRTLKAGQFVWAPQVAPDGPLLLVVSLPTQRALLFRNGVPIGASTVSTGKPGHDTPTGVFSILEKQVEHYSSKYDSAPMPYMERLTWGGVALHAGHLPGYPASHGCIRLPAGFAKLLYGTTRLGMTVVITDAKATPRVAPAPQILASGGSGDSVAQGPYEWHPERSPEGPVSIVVSKADQRAVVLRNGIEIGSASVRVDGPVAGTWAYMLKDVGSTGPQWIRVSLGSSSIDGQPVPREEWQRFRTPDAFKAAVRSVVRPGTTVVVTADSLVSGSTAAPLTIIDSEQKAR